MNTRLSRAPLCLGRRPFLGVALGGAMMAASPHALLAMQGTPVGTPTVAERWTPNPWEPEWTPDPDLFALVRRDADAVVVSTFSDGELTLPADPKRIVCLDGQEDVLIALGLGDRVVGVAGWDDAPVSISASLAAESLDMANMALFDTSALDQEAILALKPDLVIGTANEWNITDEIYAQLSPLVPVLRMRAGTFNYPRSGLRNLGAYFGLDDRAAAEVAAMDETAARGRAAIAPVVGDQKLLVVFYQGTYNALVAWAISPEGWITSPSAYTSPFHRELGMRQTDYMEAQSVASDRVDGSIYDISLEQLGTIDADILLVPMIDDEVAQKEFLSSPIIAQMPAGKAGRVYPMPFTEMVGGVHGTKRAIEIAVEQVTGEPLG